MLTAQLVSCSRHHVVEDVEAPLLFSLSDSSGLLQQVWHFSQGRKIKDGKQFINLDSNPEPSSVQKKQFWIQHFKRIQVSMLAPTMYPLTSKLILINFPFLKRKKFLNIVHNWYMQTLVMHYLKIYWVSVITLGKSNWF